MKIEREIMFIDETSNDIITIFLLELPSLMWLQLGMALMLMLQLGVAAESGEGLELGLVAAANHVLVPLVRGLEPGPALAALVRPWVRVRLRHFLSGNEGGLPLFRRIWATTTTVFEEVHHLGH